MRQKLSLSAIFCTTAMSQKAIGSQCLLITSGHHDRARLESLKRAR